jgi:hypothetical protein
VNVRQDEYRKHLLHEHQKHAVTISQLFNVFKLGFPPSPYLLPVMAYNTLIADRIREQLVGFPELSGEEKEMLGGYFYG